MKFALRAPILKYTLFGMLFLNSPAQASEPRSERMEKTAAEVIAADSAAIPKGWDNDCRASYKAGYEAGYRAGYLHGRRTATQPHSSGRASATRYADGSIVPTRDTTASGRRFMHRIGAEFRPEYIFPTNPFVEGENRAGQPIDLSLSGHLRYSFQFRPGSIPDQIYGGAYQGIGAAYYDFGNPDELGNPIAVYLFQGARIARISPRLSFNYEWNFGLSFGWKPYDDAVNPLNKMMGSKMNAYLNADFFLDWRVTREVDFTAGLSLTHFSNGNTQIPQRGSQSAVGTARGPDLQFRTEVVRNGPADRSAPHSRAISATTSRSSARGGAKASKWATSSMPRRMPTRFWDSTSPRCITSATSSVQACRSTACTTAAPT